MKNKLVTLQDHVEAGWKILSDGPSGVQLEGPKQMRLQTKVAIIIGIPLVFVYGLGLIIILLAMLDHAMAKPPTVFLAK